MSEDQNINIVVRKGTDTLQEKIARNRLAQVLNRPRLLNVSLALSAGMVFVLSGCGNLPKSEADAQQQSERQGQQGPALVDVIVAKAGALETGLEYTGITQPDQLVSLRTQTEGQLLSLAVDVGDPVVRGQVLGRLDSKVLSTTVAETQAELAALQSAVAQAQTLNL